MFDYNKILATSLWNNTIQDYLVALGILVGFLVVFKLFKSIVLVRIKKWSKKTKTDIDDELVAMIEKIPGFAYLYVAFYISLYSLNIHSTFENVAAALLIILIFYWATQAASNLIEFILYKHAKGEKGAHKTNAYFAINLVAKIVLWSTGLLLVLSNLGVNISALVASLGIGGIAIALAVQNILGDLFSSFSIYFDKPFEIGDFIIVGDHMGTVKKIGLKTTRIAALEGEEIVISNSELTSTRVRNFKKMKKRRILFEIHATYDTTNEQMKAMPKMIEKTIKKVKLCDYDRAHFKEFGDSGLIIEVVYFLESGDYKVYMDTRQEINMGIKEAFEKEGIKMAFPTRTIYMEKQ